MNGGTTLENTIIVLNTDGTGIGAAEDDIDGSSLAAASAYDLVGTDGTGSLINDTDGNLVGVTNPKLGSLANNGGPTKTIALGTAARPSPPAAWPWLSMRRVIRWPTTSAAPASPEQRTEPSTSARTKGHRYRSRRRSARIPWISFLGLCWPIAS